ncbi:hypothetical protein AB670_02968 [Chryseobacterium sp. MOF25P]|uniref:hypothetical protein n=1 Tax=unclassified Chryseobacterium TaxID=2593645 RepID=UPI000805B32F|nr:MULTISPECIES: hypothetical protein [unclassified Chryseobacterium]OBW40675.1 hypothetical protein AB670_02968 [Chryseobacterium sp. MOF25P]OBW46543.1 hypothetical protein AB671_01348 [Chryseobacterium sp. BGARF1]
MKTLSRLIFSTAFVMILAISNTAFAQETKNELAINTNSLLGNTVKRHEASPELKSSTLILINKNESSLEALKELKGEDMKGVKVLLDDSIKKKFREKGIKEIISVTTK